MNTTIKAILCALTVTMFTACGNTPQPSAKSADTASIEAEEAAEATEDIQKTEEAIKTTVSNIYRSYLTPTAEEEAEDMESEYFTPGGIHMLKYFTEELRTAMCMAANKQIATDDLFYDYDFWINAQDYDVLEHVGTDINSLDTSSRPATAKVTANIKNFGEITKIGITLQRNDAGEWLISNFIDPNTQISFAKSLEDYLSE